MKFRMIAIAIAVSGLLPLASAHAQSRVPELERAQQQARDLIAHGVRSGALTGPEADQLLRRERAFDRQLALMTRDGRFTNDERRRARDDLDRLQSDIDRKLGNRRHAAGAMPGLAQRQAVLRQRIADGVTSGRITRGQAHRLAQREQEVRERQARAQRDGVITAQERAMLREQVAMLDEDIDRMLGSHHRVRHSY